jgi:hypothetical protein
MVARMAAARDTSIPTEFSAGSTVEYERSYTDYSPADGWSLDVYLNGATSKDTASASVDGSVFVVTLSAATTGALAPGDYNYLERVSKAGVVKDVCSGIVRVTADLATANAGDLLTAEEKLLAALDVAITTKRQIGCDVQPERVVAVEESGRGHHRAT